jgi:hypothetical protein
MGLVELRERDVGWAWMARMGLCGGVLFHVGFPQLWLYTGAALALAVLLWMVAGAMPPRRVVCAITAAGVSIGIALPLLLPQFILSRQIKRPALATEGLTRQWWAALLPYPLVKSAAPGGWGSIDIQYMGHLMYFGSTFAMLLLVGLVFFFSAPMQRALAKNVWMILAALTAIYATGDAGPLVPIASWLPLSNLSAQHPFRILPLFVLFAIASGGTFMERVARVAPRQVGRHVTLVAAITLLLLGYHVGMARTAFYTYGFKPYPPLPDAVARSVERTGLARYLSWTQSRSISPLFPTTIPKNLSMEYGLPALIAYDPVLEWRPAFYEVVRKLETQPIAATEAYGIKWHLVSPLLNHMVYSSNPTEWQFESVVDFRDTLIAIAPKLKLVDQSPGVRVFEMPGVSPMAFWSGDLHALPLAIGCGGLSADLSRSPQKTSKWLTFNFLWWPQMIAFCDQKPAQCMADSWGRTVVEVPPGAQRIRVVYDAGWGRGIGAGLAVILVAILFQTAARRFNHA